MCALQSPGPASAGAPYGGGSGSGGSSGAGTAWQQRPAWRPLSKNTALWVCAATLASGWLVFVGALQSHEWITGGYTWLTPKIADERLRHPTPRRQQLLAIMLQERQQQRAAAASAAQEQSSSAAAAAGHG